MDFQESNSGRARGAPGNAVRAAAWPGSAGLREKAASAVAADVRAGAAAYDRARMLPRLIGVGAEDIRKGGPVATARILRLLARALRRERALGRAGHWTYDLNKHIGLAQA